MYKKRGARSVAVDREIDEEENYPLQYINVYGE
jgi:hypothetical protein